MHLIHFQTATGNFGDDLNFWLWDHLLPGWRDWSREWGLVGVGTILKRGFLSEGRKLVLGAGCGYGTPPDITETPEHWDIRAVRGPRTARALRLPPRAAISDPAVMLPSLPAFADPAHSGETLFVPHHLSLRDHDWALICARAGVGFQSPTDDAATVIRRLSGARHVIAESLHAAIIADAFRVPWTAVSVTAGFNTFKWADWAESLQMPAPVARPFFAPLRRALTLWRAAGLARPTPSPYPDHRKRRRHPSARYMLAAWAVADLRRAARGPFTLSDTKHLHAAQIRFRAMLDTVQRDYGGA